MRKGIPQGFRGNSCGARPCKLSRLLGTLSHIGPERSVLQANVRALVCKTDRQARIAAFCKTLMLPISCALDCLRQRPGAHSPPRIEVSADVAARDYERVAIADWKGIAKGDDHVGLPDKLLIGELTEDAMDGCRWHWSPLYARL